MLKALEATPPYLFWNILPPPPGPAALPPPGVVRGSFILVSEAFCLALLLFTFSVTSVSGRGLALAVNPYVSE